MVDFGHFVLAASWILSLYAVIAGIVGARRKNLKISKSAAHALLLSCVCAMLSLASLMRSFVRHDYSYTYVWQNSNNDMPWYYLISAVWGGMDGSMLLWATLMCVYSGFVIVRLHHVPRNLARWVPPLLAGGCNFFLMVVLFMTNPFRLSPAQAVVSDGNGLNPLLQNPSMLIHPPMLYSGFTGFIIPFAFGMAALLSGELSDQWIRLTRRSTLIAWGFLTCGIILGGNWAYIELGWGGFWAWDPVENASFLPWLTGTAYLHSVMVQERKGMLKVWTVSLSVVTYMLSVFGTFLTRSGVVQSVHAFAETDVGWVFLLYIGITAVLGVSLVLYRWKALRPERKLESYFSREAAFLFNNLVLLGICFATFWGVMFPVISEAVTGKKSVVGPPFFNQVNVPLFLMLLFLMGVGPLIAWRRSSARILFQTFAVPLGIGAVVTVFFLFLDVSRIEPALSFGLIAFVLLTIEGEFRRATKARRELRKESLPTSVVELVRRRPRRYGGFLVHLGVAIMALAITASSAYKIEKDLTLKIGERAQVGRYQLELASLKEVQFPNYVALLSEIKVFDTEGAQIATLAPERRLYARNQETTTEVDIRMTPRDDLYVALAGSETRGLDPQKEVNVAELPAILKVFVNPLQLWLWVGGLVTLFGTCIVIGPGLFESVRESLVETVSSPQKVGASVNVSEGE